MMIKKLISIAMAIMAVLIVTAQKKRLSIIPEFPQRGETVTVHFNPRVPVAGSMENKISADAGAVTLVFSSSTLYDQPYRVDMEKKKGIWTASFPLERYATFASFYLQSGEIIETPARGHYEIMVYDKKRKPVFSANLHRGYSLNQQLGKSPGLAAAQAALFKKELELYPDNYEAKLRLLTSQMNAAPENGKEKLRKEALKVIADRFYTAPTNGGNLNKVTMGYHIIGEPRRVDSIRKIVIEKYAGSDLAWEYYIGQISREKDTATKTGLLEKALQHETAANSNVFTSAHERLFELYAAKKDSAKALYHLSFMRKAEKDPYTPRMYKEITQTLLDNNLALDSAAWYAEYTLSMADSFPVGLIRYWPETGYVYPYTNDSMRQAVYSTARGNLLSMLAQINYKRGRINEAQQNMDAALQASLDKETADNAAWFFRKTNQPDRLEQLQAARMKLMEKEVAKKRIRIPAPSLEHFTTLDGKPVDTNALKNKVLLIDFWATWCGPCMEEMPYIQKLYDAYKQNPDVVFMVVNSGSRNTLKDARGWFGNRKYSFPVYYNTDPAVGDKFKFNVIPATYIINREGFIEFSNIGFEGADIEMKLKLQIDMALQ
ncbi:TlpA disulfide reductase family protein [Pseudoflavitalea rhizosphaerae]|uniref:TlpA disulfide reductase family protein n=1 Tax=Pseudoflavitalea rhizosphaerae TaxID=1884793 RepID=UPI000F8E968A|nr:TlpA disulfide reductase family protein [Pseudoflavitalea rhizosphaerae]